MTARAVRVFTEDSNYEATMAGLDAAGIESVRPGLRPDFDAAVAAEMQRRVDATQSSPRLMPPLPTFKEALEQSRTEQFNSQVKYAFVGDQRSFSVKNLDELQLVILPDMMLDHTHQGSYMLCRILVAKSGPVKHLLVVDPSDNVIWLQLAAYPILPPELRKETQQDADWVFPAGSYIAIKEPSVRAIRDSSPLIFVGSPTDLVFVDADDENSVVNRAQWGTLGTSGVVPSSPKPLWTTPLVPLRSFATWKEDGNVLATKEDFLGAIWTYTNAIKQHPSHPEVAIILTNRAHVNSKLLKPHHALADSSQALERLPSIADDVLRRTIMVKSLFRKCFALHTLQRWNEEIEVAELLINLKLYTGHIALAAAQNRQAEAQTGKYDFKYLLDKDRQEPRRRHDVADFFGPIEPGSRPEVSGGRGIFATSDIKPGTTVLAVKAITSVYDSEVTSVEPLYNFASPFDTSCFAGEARIYTYIRNQLRYKLIHQPELIPSITSFYRGLGGPPADSAPVLGPSSAPLGLDVTAVDWTATMCTEGSTRVRQASRTEQVDQCFSIMPYVHLLNHSCIPNASASWYGDFVIIRVVQPVPKGGEILISYDNISATMSSSSFLERRTILNTVMAEDCQCDWCIADRAIPEEQHETRRRLCVEAREVDRTAFSNNPGLPIPSHLQTVVIPRLRDLTGRLLKTYDPAYAFPRVELALLFSALSASHMLSGILLSRPQDYALATGYSLMQLKELGVHSTSSSFYATTSDFTYPRTCFKAAWKAFEILESIYACMRDARAVDYTEAAVKIHDRWMGGENELYCELRNTPCYWVDFGAAS